MPRTEIVVEEPAFGEVTLTCGERNVNETRAAITQNGYRARISITLNYNTFDASSIAEVEEAVTETLAQTFLRAAQLRDNNRPLFRL